MGSQPSYSRDDRRLTVRACPAAPQRASNSAQLLSRMSASDMDMILLYLVGHLHIRGDVPSHAALSPWSQSEVNVESHTLDRMQCRTVRLPRRCESIAQLPAPASQITCRLRERVGRNGLVLAPPTRARRIGEIRGTAVAASHPPPAYY